MLYTLIHPCTTSSVMPINRQAHEPFWKSLWLTFIGVPYLKVVHHELEPNFARIKHIAFQRSSEKDCWSSRGAADGYQILRNRRWKLLVYWYQACVCVCVSEWVSECVCVCEGECVYTHIYIHICIESSMEVARLLISGLYSWYLYSWYQAHTDK